MRTDPRLQRWLDHIDGDRSEASLRPLLADNVTFFSPVVFTPQPGIERTVAYLTAADSVFGTGSFDYVRTLVDGDNAMMEFAGELDGIFFNGIDLIHWNEDGLIDDFKVMVRPLQAINKLWEMMGQQLEKQAG